MKVVNRVVNGRTSVSAGMALRLGARGVVLKHIVRHLRELTDASRRETTPADRLTARERQVIAGVATGQSNREIANQLWPRRRRRSIPHITKDPGVCSGRPCVEGTRVRVVDILALHEAGLSSGEIVKEFTTLSGPADVYAALLYHHDHKSEIEADLKQDQALAAQYEREHPGR